MAEQPRREETRVEKTKRAKLMARFLKVFRSNRGKLYLSAERIGVSRNTVWEWRQMYPEFAEKYDECFEASTDEIEKEMERRAVKDSDGLIQFSLRKRRKEYRDSHRVELSGEDGKPLAFELVSFAAIQPATKGKLP